MGQFTKSIRTRLLIGVATGALTMSAGFAVAQERSPIRIAPQSLTSALQEFGSQTSRQVMFTPGLIASKASAGVSGAVDEQLALTQLLQGTGLAFRREGDIYMIVQAGEGGSGPQGASAGDVDALIVTAQKREESIQDVPIAMSAFTQEALERSQIAGGPDLMTQVPNMTFTKTNFASYSIQIRGIGTQAISATTDPAVAVAFNNTPFVRNRFFEQEFYDLQRVEVLRGPQGTLYGRNATAGVVNIISAKPKFLYEAKLSGDVGNYGSTRVEGMVNIPIVEDAVALRLAGAWTKRDGYATNELTGNPIDGRDLWSTRLSLRVAPTDRFDANLIWEHFEENDDRLRSGKQLCKKDRKTEIDGVPMPPVDFQPISSPPTIYSQGCVAASLYGDESFQTPNGHSLPYYLPLSQIGLPVFAGLDPYLKATQSRDLRVIESTIDPVYRAKSDLAELQVSYDLTDNLTLASETAYSADTIWSMQDYNRFSTAPHAFNENYTFPNVQREGMLGEGGVFCDPQLGCSDRVLAADLSTAKSRQFSQELRLSSDFDGPFNFNLGANYLRYDTEDKYYVFINTLTLTAASLNVVTPPSPWVPGVTDNHDCLNYLKVGDATQIQQFGLTPCTYIDPNPIGSLNDEGHNYFLSRNPYKLISYAAFGEAYYNIADNLKLTAGLRMTVDKKEAPILPSWLLASGTVGYPVLEVVRQKWSKPTGRLTLDWKPDVAFTDETLLYASYAHGYKAGGANPPPTTIVTYLGEGADVLLRRSLTHPRTFDAEYVDAFEIGSKNTLLNGSLTLNVNAFYYDYKGYQISQIIDRAATNLNFDAEVWGAEIEVDWKPLDNLRFGLKGGYENTRVADGMQAIDLMDRTAGNPEWIVARPFPTIPSNCIVPVSMVAFGGRINVPPGRQTPNQGPCIMAYQLGVDPITELPYVLDPEFRKNINDPNNPLPLEPKWDGYRGFNPASAPNNGEGFSKDLGGNELPNAPHFTATLTADYTAPLVNDWMLTLHGDLYYQSEAWTRIFNMEGYDKLKAYSNLNLAAIFANEESGWNIMAYVKNVMNRDSITGAFLNSDDTGLTTNVFLTEPRLYGLRVSKNFTGGPLLGSFGGRHDGPYPITIEVGGSALRSEAENDPMSADELDVFTPTLLPDSIQNRDLDSGDGGEVRVIYRLVGTPWRVSAGARFGKANGGTPQGVYSELADQEKVCGWQPSLCQNPIIGTVEEKYTTIPTNSSWVHAWQREEHVMVDFMVGRDVGMGAGDLRSSLSVGLGYARLKSRADLNVKGIPDWVVRNGFFDDQDAANHHWYDGTLTSEREFEGVGPVVSWEAAQRLRGDEQSGALSLAWAVGGGVLFGKQNADLTGDILSNYYLSSYGFPWLVDSSERIPVERQRSKSTTVPTANLSLGLTYEIDRFKVDTGYRWERYFNAIDGGDRERKSFDRTIDGPYFRLSVGFGG